MSKNFHAQFLRKYYERDIDNITDPMKLDVLRNWYTATCRSIAEDGTIEDLKAVTKEYDLISDEITGGENK